MRPDYTILYLTLEICNIHYLDNKLIKRNSIYENKFHNELHK